MTEIAEESGWLRAATFGGMDGLTTSFALVIGLVANDLSLSIVIASALLAALAGSISMGIGEYTSVITHNEQPDAIRFNPYVAAISSFICFGVGSIIPIAPLLFGYSDIFVLVLVGQFALFGAGALATLFTHRSWWFGGTRQLVLGTIATLFTFVLGVAIS